MIRMYKVAGLAVVGILAIGLSAAPAMGASKSAITLKESKTVTTTGSPDIFSGTVTPHKTRRTVHLQRYNRRKWATVASTRANSRGTYSIRWVIASAGRQLYRVTTPATKTAGGVVSKSVAVTGRRWHFLSDINPVDGCNCGGNQTEINGTKYLHTVEDEIDDDGDTDFTEFNLERKCISFRAVAGLDDSSDTGSAGTIEVSADGNGLFSQNFGIGQSTKVSENITGNLRIRFDFTDTSGQFGFDGIALGNAQILCDF